MDKIVSDLYAFGVSHIQRPPIAGKTRSAIGVDGVPVHSYIFTVTNLYAGRGSCGRVVCVVKDLIFGYGPKALIRQLDTVALIVVDEVSGDIVKVTQFYKDSYVLRPSHGITIDPVV